MNEEGEDVWNRIVKEEEEEEYSHPSLNNDS